MSREVVIVRTGVANLASVLAALERVGAIGRVSDDRDDIDSAPAVVLPGVGAFGPAMAHLRALSLDAAIARRVEAGRPLLAVCLGLQLLCESSEESPGARGIGAVRGRVGRFAPPTRAPQLGWNAVEAAGGAGLVTPGHAYFANSYRLAAAAGDPPDGWRVATADHGGPFVAALERGPILACQFHPELSGDYGRSLLRRWLDRAYAEAPPTGGAAPC